MIRDAIVDAVVHAPDLIRQVAIYINYFKKRLLILKATTSNYLKKKEKNYFYLKNSLK